MVDPSFQRLNKVFVFSFESDAVRTGLKSYFLPTLEIKD